MSITYTESPGELMASSLVARLIQADLAQAQALIAVGAVWVGEHRLRHDQPVSAGARVGVFPRPRHYRVEAVRWRERLIEETERFLIVDKPAGIPTTPTRDNALENVTTQLALVVGMPLHPVHRLDIATRGLLCLGKTPAFHRRFQRLRAEGRLVKRYRALVPRALEVGTMVHYQNPSHWLPREMSLFPRAGWKRCELRIDAVLECPRYDAFEVVLTLITGRPHQIRSQCAAIGAPLLGDRLYGSSRPLPGTPDASERIALEAFELAFPDESGVQRRYSLSPDW